MSNKYGGTFLTVKIEDEQSGRDEEFNKNNKFYKGTHNLIAEVTPRKDSLNEILLTEYSPEIR